MNPLALLRFIVGSPLPPDATVSSPEFAEMKRATEVVISGANTITAEIKRMETAIRKARRT